MKIILSFIDQVCLLYRQAIEEMAKDLREAKEKAASCRKEYEQELVRRQAFRAERRTGKPVRAMGDPAEFSDRFSGDAIAGVMRELIE